MSCPQGYITRNAYIRKSKKGLTSSSQTKSKSIERSIRVSKGCTPDKGKPGKTRLNQRILPKPSKDRSLKKYGYTVNKSDDSRKKALREASNVYGELAVLRRLNLIRNYQSEEKNKKKMSKDVDYMSKKYKLSRNSKKSKRRSKKGSKRDSKRVSKRKNTKKSRK